MSDSAIPKLITECVEQGVRLQDVERELITLTLEHSGQNVRGAADKLGITLRSLYGKMQQLKIRRFTHIPISKKEIFLSSRQALGMMVREARLRRGMSPKELAYSIGYNTDTVVFHIESGRRGIPAKKVERIASALKIPIPALQQAIQAARSDSHEHQVRSESRLREA